MSKEVAYLICTNPSFGADRFVGNYAGESLEDVILYRAKEDDIANSGMFGYDFKAWKFIQINPGDTREAAMRRWHVAQLRQDLLS